MINKKSINKVILIGHIGNAPEVRYTKEGTLIASFSLATHELQNDEKNHTEWHNIIAWGKIGEFVDQYIKKGQLVCIEGRLKTRKWTAKEGHTLSKTEIISTNVVPLDWKK